MELLPIQMDFEEIQSPTSSVITQEVIKAYEKIGGSYQHVVPFALLEARKYFKAQSHLNPSDSDENLGRMMACEALARKLVSRIEMNRQYRILSARYTIIESDGDETLPLSALESAVDQQATFFLSSNETQRCVFALWRGLLVQTAKEDGSIEYMPYEGASKAGGFLSHFDPNRVGVPRYQFFFRIFLWILFILAYSRAIQTPDREFGLEDIVLYVQVAGYLIEDVTKIWKIWSYVAFGFWTINLMIWTLLGIAFGYRIADLSAHDVHQSEHFRELSFQFLACASPLIWMKLLTVFDLFQYFGTLQIVTFRMMRESAVFFTLLALLAVGFGQALTGLDVTDPTPRSTEAVVHSLIQGLLGSPTFDVYERGSDSYPFGLILYYAWSILTLVILLNILVALFGSAYQECTDEAVPTFLAFFSGKTVAAIRAPDEFVYAAPFNLIEVLILPLELVLPKKTYAQLNRYLMSFIFFVPLCAIALFETHFDHHRRRDYALLSEEEDEYTGEDEDPTVDEGGNEISKTPFEELKKAMPNLTRSSSGEILWQLKNVMKEIEELKKAQAGAGAKGNGKGKFKKPPSSTKSTNPVRSSDLRKLRAAVVASYPAIPTSLASLLLPDGTTSTRVLTHLEEPVVVYSNPDGEPLFFRYTPPVTMASHKAKVAAGNAGKEDEDVLVPSCYTCDRVPGLLEELVTAKEVVENLISGSALFAAGVSPRSLTALSSSLVENSLVAVTAQGSSEVVAVGTLAGTKQQLVDMDRKGKALHARGDFLWKMGSGEMAAPLRAKSSHTATTAPPPTDSATDSPAPTTTPDPAPELASLSLSESAPATPEAISQTLRTAFLLALRNSPPASSALPLPASALYASHILPYRPASGPGATAEIKKSGYKKVDKLFKALAKEGIVVVKDVKGECVVLSVNSKHAEVEATRSYRTVAQAATQAAAAAAADPSSSTSTTSGGASASASKITVRDLVKVPPNVVAVLFPTPPESELIPPHVLKSALTAYIASQSLTHPRDGKYIILDAPLSSLLLSSSSAPPKKVGAFTFGDSPGEVIAKDECHKRLMASSVAYCGMTMSPGGDEVTKKGSPPRIKIALKTVGKRMVSLITGVEAFGLACDKVADELRVRAAGSTAVQQIQGSSPKNPKFEVMVQGSHEVLITKLLVEMGVPKTLVDVDNSKVKR